MSDVVEVEYKANVAAFKSDLKTVEAAMKGVESTGKQAAQNTQKEFQSAGSSIKSAVKDIAVSLGLAFGTAQVISFGKESVKAFVEAEENANHLRFAVQKIGGEGAAAFQKLIDQSSKLQNISIFSDDDIQKSQTQLTTLGLNSDQVEELIPKILDLASATGQDLGSATQTIIQGINGQTRGLKAVGLEFENTGDKTKNLAILTQNLNKFQGATAEALETTAGKSKRLENAFGELQETIGQFIVESGNDLLDFFDGVSQGFDSVITKRATGKLSEAFTAENVKIINDAKTSEKRRLELVADTQANIIEISKRGLAEQDAQRKAFLLQGLKAEQQLLKDLQTLNDKKGSLGAIAGSSNGDDKAKQAREKAAQELKDFDAKVNSELLESKADTELKKLELARDESLAELEVKSDAARKAGVNEATITEENNSSIRAIIEKFNTDKASLDKEAQDKEFDEAMAQQDKLEHANLESVKKNLDERLKLEEESSRKRKKIEEDFQKTTVSLISDVGQLSANITEQKIQDSDRQTEREIKNLDYQLSKKEISQSQYDAKVKALEDQKEAKQRAAKKQQFEIDRQISIAKIIIATAQAVITQFAETGYYGAILAGIVGAAELAVVASQPTPKFEKGGRVKGKRHRAGGETIEAEVDEWVIKRKEAMKNDRLLSAINEGIGDKFIHDYYVAPALKAQQNKIREINDRSFASSIAASIGLNFKDANMLDAIKQSRKSDRENALFIVKNLKQQGKDARRF